MPISPRPSSLGDLRARRVEFDISEFIRTLELHGYDAVWSKAQFCPNRDPKQHDHHYSSCSLCDANGMLYFDPITIRVLATSYGLKQLFMPESRYEPGTAYFTTLPEYKLSFWDKIQLTTAKTRFSEVVTTQRALSYRFKYPVISVERVINNKGAVVPNDTITVNNDGTITFADAHPPGGDFFSISYFYHPTYVMIDMLHSIRDQRITLMNQDQEVDFPTQAVGRLQFLVQNEAALENP